VYIYAHNEEERDVFFVSRWLLRGLWFFGFFGSFHPKRFIFGKEKKKTKTKRT